MASSSPEYYPPFTAESKIREFGFGSAIKGQWNRVCGDFLTKEAAMGHILWIAVQDPDYYEHREWRIVDGSKRTIRLPRF